jgi:hypothetical protein
MHTLAIVGCPSFRIAVGKGANGFHSRWMRSYIALGWRSETVRGKLIAAVLLTLVASRSGAQEHPHRNGEKLGPVHFATSCNDVAQKEFNRAVAQR